MDSKRRTEKKETKVRFCKNYTWNKWCTHERMLQIKMNFSTKIYHLENPDTKLVEIYIKKTESGHDLETKSAWGHHRRRLGNQINLLQTLFTGEHPALVRNKWHFKLKSFWKRDQEIPKWRWMSHWYIRRKTKGVSWIVDVFYAIHFGFLHT